MFISIGKYCSVKYNIDKFTVSKETLFFDWLITDMDSVNMILGIENIDNILFFENIIQNPINSKHDNNSRIIIKSLPLCESIHDIPYLYNSSHIHEFIKKYKRRYERIIEYIKNEPNIYFIRIGEITNTQKRIFINNILKINLKCNFKLVELQEQKKIISDTHFISINLNNYRINNVNHNNWKKEHWNWKKIFSDIMKHDN